MLFFASFLFPFPSTLFSFCFPFPLGWFRACFSLVELGCSGLVTSIFNIPQCLPDAILSHLFCLLFHGLFSPPRSSPEIGGRPGHLGRHLRCVRHSSTPPASPRWLPPPSITPPASYFPATHHSTSLITQNMRLFPSFNILRLSLFRLPRCQPRTSFSPPIIIILAITQKLQTFFSHIFYLSRYVPILR